MYRDSIVLEYYYQCTHTRTHTHTHIYIYIYIYTYIYSQERSEWFPEKLIQNITDSDNSSNHRRSTCKIFRGNTVVCSVLRGI